MNGKASFLFPLVLLSTAFSIHLSASEEFSLEKEVTISLEVLESLEKLKEHPLDINRASYDELLLIPYLSPLLCLRIMSYRQEHTFGNYNDLLTIAGINEPLLERIMPYITIGQKSLTPQEKRFSFRSLVSRTFPGDTSFTGNPLAFSSRFSFSRKPFSIGAATFKDAYESSFTDFYTLYGEFRKDDVTLIIGDYAMDIGERLISGYPGFVFKSSGVVKGRETMVRPYTSGFEDFAYRGGAVEKRWHLFDTALFLSMNRLDATFENNTAKRVIYETGYHRTLSEIEKKNRIEERVAGATASIGNSSFRIRTTYSSGWYNTPVDPDQTHYYRFRGREYALYGLHIRYATAHTSLWSEYARSALTGGAALVLGMSAKPRSLSVVMLYRDYSETYFAPRAFSFCETEVRNERGLYSFISARLPLRIKIAGYLDVFSRPFPTYQSLFPTNGYEAFLSMETKIMGATWYLRYKYKEKNNYQWLDENLISVRQTIRSSAKIPLNGKSTFTVLLQAGAFAVPEIQVNEQGYLLTISLRSGFLNNATAESGVVMFNTESYDSRMYLFINDVPGVLQSRPFYEQGFDGYLLAKITLSAHLRIYGKFEIEKKKTSEQSYRLGVEWR